jgi:hypothetical protein
MSPGLAAWFVMLGCGAESDVVAGQRAADGRVMLAASQRRKRWHFPHLRILGVNDPVWYVEEYCVHLPDVRRYRDRMLPRLVAHDLYSEKNERAVGARVQMANDLLSMPWADACLSTFDSSP